MSRAGEGSITFNLRVAAEPFPWRNPALRLDVDNDTFVSPIDAVLIINLLNAGGGGQLPWREQNQAVAPFYDVSADNFVAPIDAVEVINYLNALPLGSAAASSGGEGEANEEHDSLSPAVPAQDSPANILHSSQSGTEYSALFDPLPQRMKRRMLTKGLDSLADPGVVLVRPSAASLDAVFSAGGLAAILATTLDQCVTTTLTNDRR